MSRRRPWLWLLFAFVALIAVFGAFMWGLNRLLVGATPELAARNILTVRLAGAVVERPTTLWASDPIGPLSVREIDRALRRAATDERIDAVALKIGPLSTGFGKAQEIRDAVAVLRAAGKPVTAYLEIGSILDLYVASAASHIVQVPSGNLILGLLSRTLYYRELLDRLGIQLEVIHTGPYKTAMNPYTATGMSEQERQAVESLLDSIWQQILSDISRDRGLQVTQVETALDSGLLSASEAREAGLVDDLGFDDQSLPGSTRRISLRDYWRAAGDEGGWLAPVIAVVHVDGMIVPGNAGEDLFSGSVAAGDAVASHLRAARRDAKVRAIVLRIDSPGGVVSASDVIWREAALAAEDKPLLVSMSDVAASGGYWIATAAPRIFADPSTYTGSIGVVASRLNFAGTYDKLGVGSAAVKRGVNADLFLDSAPLRPEQHELLQRSVSANYRAFLEKVATARAMDVAAVERLASGRVWTGNQALEVGLIDELGGLHAAIEAAAQSGGVAPGSYRVRVYPQPRSLFQQLSGLLSVATAPQPDLAGDLDRAAAVGSLDLRGRALLLRRMSTAGHVWALLQGPTPVPAR